MKEDARAAVNRHVRIRIAGSDISSLVVEKAGGKTPAARASATCSTTDALPSVRATPAKPVPKKAWRPDFLIANPPYGEQVQPEVRLHPVDDEARRRQSEGQLRRLDRLDAHLRPHAPAADAPQESRKTVLFNGPLECRFFRFDMVAGSNRRKPREEADE